MINDILDLSKIESGATEVDKVSSNFHILKEVQEMFSLKASEKRHQTELLIADNIIPWVYSDAAKIRGILINLIGNAIKFTNEGGYDSGTNQSKKDSHRLLIEVEDTGTGIRC